ncbi:manganese-dependent inorganic pyrophosphatase [Listeria monocytogenes]|jgi:Inorganic pyrophosphatase/exopolyphosphatase|uniref:Probable manganese-dependent inorganic pyrophosphatase n=7 Tax=Bacilli TaxID=91061 RepID=PPAC_LISMO|nr:manganese-dependent inorganic pyrophosphatase [Listeria monocytogenes]NP_464973.1 manganese-dependent inorganic pyrophosphatase [Listeria monocytogenes EGD-e]C1KV95.1 RecName: Full=Probable manganese-dependent inorganic pyrophosphatase; AltName: Full=Pyrophosphate phospho-hydrolase; Short=PPase [Listeria monocytogenes serotype 4b str. CLIP 80459]Q8Y757.1 RecName: Full=Probable manganese-dependent inorganic pyrophosphatase; AltName: Full=Pyrophosphate phospho-hydrolase; Short=PPase [Listeria m
MTKTLVFGHKNPDTDTICSAISYAELKKAQGADIEAVRLGELNSETAFVLDYFQVTAPRLVQTVANEVSEVALVDHNERQQSVDDIDDVTVTAVVDHHRIANFETSDPLYYRAEPVGCTTTILLKMFRENEVEVSKTVAGLMLSAIISDTLLFQSPTCTEEDKVAAQKLAQIADVDIQSYGMEMLKAGADVSKKTVAELLLDAKEFNMNDNKVEIAQINVVDVNDVLSRRAEVEALMTQNIVDKGLDLYLFVITNILTNDSVGIAIGSKTAVVEEAYGVKFVENQAPLKGVVSRKKQVVPILTDTFAK